MPHNEIRSNSSAGLSYATSMQARAIAALTIRDIMLRYGRNNIGFFWFVIEPLILTAGVLLVRHFIMSPYEHGIQLLSMIMTGYLPLTLWRHISNQGVFLFRRNLGLLYHRNVTLMDTFLAMVIRELGGVTAAFLIVYFSLLAVDAIKPVADWGILLVGWIAMAFLASGIALFFAVITEYAESAERFIQPFQYITLPLCGCFFLVNWLPTTTQNLAWFIPTVHCYEMFRAGYFGDLITAHYTIWYPFLWGLFFLALGFSFIEAVRDRLHSS